MKLIAARLVKKFPEDSLPCSQEQTIVTFGNVLVFTPTGCQLSAQPLDRMKISFQLSAAASTHQQLVLISGGRPLKPHGRDMSRVILFWGMCGRRTLHKNTRENWFVSSARSDECAAKVGEGDGCCKGYS